MWKGYKEATTVDNATSNGDEQRPLKRLRIAGTAPSRCAFLKSHLDARNREEEELQGNEYEQWKRERALPEDSAMAYNPL
jgi:hypothetical protein